MSDIEILHFECLHRWAVCLNRLKMSDFVIQFFLQRFYNGKLLVMSIVLKKRIFG